MNTVSQVDQAFIYITGVSAVILLLITAVMIYFVIRYRRSNHPVPEDIRGNWKLEVVWTIVPTIIALVMFYYGWQSYLGLRNVPPGALEIEVQAQQFSWIFIYANEKETEGELVVPFGKPIKLNITSIDVLHSFFLPAYRVKVDAVNGLDSYVWFYADRLGEFDIQCTELCGTEHSQMLAVLKIIPEAEYEKWLETEEDEEEYKEVDEKDGN